VTIIFNVEEIYQSDVTKNMFCTFFCSRKKIRQDQ